MRAGISASALISLSISIAALLRADSSQPGCTDDDKVRYVQIAILLAKCGNTFGSESRLNHPPNHTARVDHQIEIGTERTMNVVSHDLWHHKFAQIFVNTNIAFLAIPFGNVRMINLVKAGMQPHKLYSTESRMNQCARVP
jgi:hypothetical protein